MNRGIFSNWQPVVTRDQTTERQLRTVNLNFGPQHPAAHGVLRLILQLNGEIVERLDPHIGLLHRGTEKLIETKPYTQSLPYFDRLDYVSMLCQEHAYCLAIESLLQTYNFTATFIQIRTLYDEITRILNHLLAISCHALDVGSMSSVFWAFEEREKLMEFYERVSGARMHAAFYRPCEINNVAITPTLLEDMVEFCRVFYTSLNEMHNVLTYNKIWKQRLIGIGAYDQFLAAKYGLTGVMARCTGIKRDLRLSRTETYGNYYYLNFRSYIGQNGDCYDRFLIRMNEMVESTNIMSQLISKIYHPAPTNTKKEFNANRFDQTLPHTILNYTASNFLNKKIFTKQQNTMEQVIKHFKKQSTPVPLPSGITYQAVESPKGEFGVTIISDDSAVPFRCKIRSPAFYNLQVLPIITKGHLLADLVTNIGTIDIVFGEIDR